MAPGSGAARPVGSSGRSVLGLSLFWALNAAALLWLARAQHGAASAPRVLRIEPEGRVQPKGPITVVFSGPVVSADAADRPDPTAMIRLVPAVPGVARWSAADQLAFEPAAPLALGATFDVILSSDIGRAAGEPILGERRFTIAVEPLKLLGASQVGFTRETGATVRLILNGRVRPQDLRPHLQVLDAALREAPYDIVGVAGDCEVDLRCEAGGEKLFVVLGPPRGAASSPLGLVSESRIKVSLTEALRVTDAIGERVTFGTPSLEVFFSHPIARSPRSGSGPARLRFEEHFAVNPATPFTAAAGWSSVVLTGPFEPGLSYRVTVKNGLPGAGGSVLEADETRDVRVPDRQASLSFRGKGRFLPGPLNAGKRTVTLQTVGVESVSLRAFHVQASNVVHWLHLGWQETRSSRALAPRVRRLPPIPGGGASNGIREVAIGLLDVVGPDQRGVWYLEASGQETGTSKLICVSDIAITAKESARDSMTVWTASLMTGEPVGGARVGLWTISNQLLGEAVSGPDGLVFFPGPLTGGDGSPYLVTAELDGDLAYLELRRQRLSRAHFDVGGRPVAARLDAFIFTERGVYNPGETVHVRALVRRPGGALPGSLPVEVEVLRPDGNRLRLEKAAPGREGSFSLDVPLPPSAVTGLYRVKVLLPGGSGPEDAAPVELGSELFRVEERLPFRLEASMALAEGSVTRGAGGTLRRFRPGDVAVLVVKGTHLFGLPAAGCEVDASWRVVMERFDPPGWKGFRFGELSPRGIRIDRDRETSFLDHAGKARFQLELPDVETASLMRLELTAAVKDLAGRAVTAELHALMDPAVLYLGLRLDAPEGSRGRIDAGKPARFECIAVRPDGSLAAMEAADLLVQEVIWHSALKETPDGAFAYESRDEVREITRQRVPFSGGRGAFEHTFEGGGSYRLRVRDPASLAAAEISVEASGGPARSLENPDRVEILFADPRYPPGSTARVILRAPFGGTLLLTTESNAVQTARVISMPRNTLETDVPVPEDARSGLYVAASLVRGVEPDETRLPQRAYGIAPIPLDLSAQRLTVTLHAPREARPGSRSVVRAVVADSAGEPLAGAEVFLALVDDHAPSLARRAPPDPFELFHGKRAHGVELSDSYLSLLEEVPLDREASRPEADRAGASEAAEEVRPRRMQARGVDTQAMVLGPFTTGEDGGVVADFELPRFLGEVRLFAVASAGERFGASDQSVLVRGPFFFEMRLPRFLAPGDVFTAPVEVHNRTGASGVPALTWMLEGIVEGLDAESSRPAPFGEPGPAPFVGPVPAGESLAFAASKDDALEVPSGGSRRLDFKLRALERQGKASARLEASIGSETWSETIELPVRSTAPRVVRRESGEVTAETPLEISPRGKYLAGTSRSTLILSSLPTLELVGSLGWLLDNTHEGLEPITSRVFPLLYRTELAGGTVEDHLLKHPAANSIAGSVAGADDLVLAGVRGLLELQGHGGWLAAWPGTRVPWAWGTLYAAHFLVEARTVGHAVPEAEMEALLRHVESTTLSTEIAPSRDSESDARILETAYALYVLALAGRPGPGAMDALREAFLARERAGDPAPPSAIYLLAGAFHLAGDGESAREIISGDLPPPGEERETGGALQSAPREAAILLSMLLDVDPASSHIPILVSRLKDYRVAGRWGTTQENAFALIALGKHARMRSGTRADYRAEVSVAGGDAVILGPGEERVYTWESLEGSVRVTVTGTGALHYHWSEEGVPAGGASEDGDHSIAVRRRYLDRNLAPLDPSAVPAGDPVVVEITVESDRRMENVAVTDRFPAGLEVESIALSGALAAAAARDGAPSAALLSPEHVSLRDDRVVFFVSLEARTRGVYRYAARAVTRGIFRLPPVEAEAVYEPETRSVWGGGSFTVK